MMILDSYTKTIARLITSFFYQYDLKNEIASTSEEIVDLLIKFINDKSAVVVSDIKVKIEKVEGGYSGSLFSPSLNRPLLFEVTQVT